MYNKLREYRLSKHLQQKEVAQAVGISQKYISLLELGQRQGSYRVLAKIAHFFNCAIEDIFPLDEKQDKSA